MNGSAGVKSPLTSPENTSPWAMVSFLTGAPGLKSSFDSETQKVFGRVAVELQVDPARLPARKGAPEKVRAAARMRATTSVSNGGLARKLQMGKPATVSQYRRRFRLAQEDQTREFRHLLSIVNT